MPSLLTRSIYEGLISTPMAADKRRAARTLSTARLGQERTRTDILRLHRDAGLLELVNYVASQWIAFGGHHLNPLSPPLSAQTPVKGLS